MAKGEKGEQPRHCVRRQPREEILVEVEEEEVGCRTRGNGALHAEDEKEQCAQGDREECSQDEGGQEAKPPLFHEKTGKDGKKKHGALKYQVELVAKLQERVDQQEIEEEGAQDEKGEIASAEMPPFRSWRN